MNLENSKTEKPKKALYIFHCPYNGCMKKFKTNFALDRHMVVHYPAKKYKCKYCNKKFALLQYKKEHQYIHTEEKPYICGVDGCTERFRQAGKLSIHRKTHKSYQTKQYDYSLNPKLKKAIRKTTPPPKVRQCKIKRRNIKKKTQKPIFLIHRNCKPEKTKKQIQVLTPKQTQISNQDSFNSAKNEESKELNSKRSIFLIQKNNNEIHLPFSSSGISDEAEVDKKIAHSKNSTSVNFEKKTTEIVFNSNDEKNHYIPNSNIAITKNKIQEARTFMNQYFPNSINQQINVANHLDFRYARLFSQNPVYCNPLNNYIGTPTYSYLPYPYYTGYSPYSYYYPTSFKLDEKIRQNGSK